MAKVVNMNPDIVRVGATARKVLFSLNFNAYDNVSGSGTVTVRVATKEDFSDATIITPSTFYHKLATDPDWATVSSNTITSDLQSKNLRVDLPALSAESKQYVKVLFTVGGVTFESSPTLYTAYTEIDFKLQTPVGVSQVRPVKVKVLDHIKATVTSPFTIKVEVCNNAQDATPTWENATDAYLTNKYYTFTNTTKKSANWAISVRYYIKKNNATDIIEVSDLYIAFV